MIAGIKTHWRGFTLIELMTVLAIALILLGIGVPSFRALIENQRMTSTVNDFFAAINLTRSEAIKRGRRVDLVPASENDWAEGWVVFVDEDDDQLADDDEQIIFSHGPVDDTIAIEANFTDDSGALYIAYNGTGRTRTNNNSQTVQSGTFTFTSAGQTRRVSLNFVGRPRVCNPGPDNNTC